MNHRVYPNAERHAAAWTFTLGVVFFLAVIVSQGCSVQESYVEAERAIYEQIAERYKDYTVSDQSLTDATRRRRLRTVVAWDARLTQAEKK